MPSRSAQVVREVQKGTPLGDVDPSILDINSQGGRERKIAEIKRRLRSVDEHVWEDLPDLPSPQQALVLYYCSLSTYSLLFDFHMEAVLPAWKSVDRSFGPHDATRFLEEQAKTHPEIEEWQESTSKRVQEAMLQMIREAGLLQKGASEEDRSKADTYRGDTSEGKDTREENRPQKERLHRVDCPGMFWTRFVEVGALWFLKAAFLNEEMRSSAIEAMETR